MRILLWRNTTKVIAQVYVEALTALAAADSSMRLTVIDTLSNLNLAAKFHEDIRRLGLEALHAARDEEISVIIRFIMQSADSVEELRPLMRELRLNVVPTVSNLPPGVVIEAIKNGFRDNRHAVTAFLKELGALGAGDARPIDVWFLIALLSLAHHRKAGESAVKKLAGAQLLTAKILREAIVGHAQTLQPYFSVLLNLASRFIRSAENAGSWPSLCCKVILIVVFRAGARRGIGFALLPSVRCSREAGGLPPARGHRYPRRPRWELCSCRGWR